MTTIYIEDLKMSASSDVLNYNFLLAVSPNIMLSQEAAAHVLQKSIEVLAELRREKCGPEYSTLNSGKCFYRVGELIRWLKIYQLPVDKPYTPEELEARYDRSPLYWRFAAFSENLGKNVSGEIDYSKEAIEKFIANGGQERDPKPLPFWDVLEVMQLHFRADSKRFAELVDEASTFLDVYPENAIPFSAVEALVYPDTEDQAHD